MDGSVRVMGRCFRVDHAHFGFRYRLRVSGDGREGCSGSGVSRDSGSGSEKGWWQWWGTRR